MIGSMNLLAWFATAKFVEESYDRAKVSLGYFSTPKLDDCNC
jgi:hypothetical protein